ncbi:MAG: protein phosphatase CheZ [Burkholderiaceae bacterium]
MKIDPAALLAPSHAAAAESPEMFRQLGHITRQRHATLTALGVMSNGQDAPDGLPDACSRLGCIARKTHDAAGKVLNSVEQAKLEHASIGRASHAMAAAVLADPVRAVASGALLNFVGDVEAATGRTDRHLTDILLAHNLHDLTGQGVAKLIAMADNHEASLVKRPLQAAPPEPAHQAEDAQRVERAGLPGPVVDAAGRSDVAANPGEVDDLLASLGF